MLEVWNEKADDVTKLLAEVRQLRATLLAVAEDGPDAMHWCYHPKLVGNSAEPCDQCLGCLAWQQVQLTLESAPAGADSELVTKLKE